MLNSRDCKNNKEPLLRKQQTTNSENNSIVEVFQHSKQKGVSRACLFGLVSFANQKAKDSATGNNVNILSGALTYFLRTTTTQTNQGTQNQKQVRCPQHIFWPTLRVKIIWDRLYQYSYTV